MHAIFMTVGIVIGTLIGIAVIGYLLLNVVGKLFGKMFGD